MKFIRMTITILMIALAQAKVEENKIVKELNLIKLVNETMKSLFQKNSKEMLQEPIKEKIKETITATQNQVQ